MRQVSPLKLFVADAGCDVDIDECLREERWIHDSKMRDVFSSWEVTMFLLAGVVLWA